MNWLWTLLINMATLGITSVILPGIKVKSFWSAFFAVIVVSLLNTFVRPLLDFISLPLNALTLGLFTWVITAVILWLASKLVSGLQIKNFGWALLGGLVMAIINSLLLMILPVAA